MIKLPKPKKFAKLCTAFTSGVIVAGIAVFGIHALGLSMASSPYVPAQAETGSLTDDPQNLEDLVSSAPYSANITVPSTLQANVSQTLTARFSQNPSTSPVIIDVEIYNAANQRIYQYSQADQTLSSTATPYTFSWTPTNNGSYQIKLGIFGANWASTLFWNDTAGTTAVSGGMPAAAVMSNSGGTSWGGLPFYDDPTNDATNYYAQNPTAPGASLIAREGDTPTADWFGGWDSNITTAAASYVSAAANAKATPVLILYNIPDRDCGGFSAGGAQDEASYESFVQGMANGIGNNNAVVIVEPDALAGIDCLSPSDQATRYDEINKAVAILKANPDTHVYIDAGHPGWQSAATSAQRLNMAGIAGADGFSLNISNFVSTPTDLAYGNQISALVGNKHFIVDTSRNGNGVPAGSAWCNPTGTALGQAPTSDTGDSLADAFIWAKGPWGSDGPCNGGPAAGADFWSYAIQLAENSNW
jgi:endoglucanase